MSLKPFMRWAGGKRWSAPDLVQFARSLDGGKPVAYCEPFLGGGAWLAEMLSAGMILKNHCYLGDLAPEAFLAWKGVLRNPSRTVMEVRRWFEFVETHPEGRENAYYLLRDRWNGDYWKPGHQDLGMEGKDLCEVAGLLIVLNRLSFKGLLRVGPNGFNTPYGHLPERSTSAIEMAVVLLGDAVRRSSAILRAVGGCDQIRPLGIHASRL